MALTDLSVLGKHKAVATDTADLRSPAAVPVRARPIGVARPAPSGTSRIEVGVRRSRVATFAGNAPVNGELGVDLRRARRQVGWVRAASMWALWSATAREVSRVAQVIEGPARLDRTDCDQIGGAMGADHHGAVEELAVSTLLVNGAEPRPTVVGSTAIYLGPESIGRRPRGRRHDVHGIR